MADTNVTVQETPTRVSIARGILVGSGGSGDGCILDGVSSSVKATVLDYLNSNPLAVRLTDTVGDYLATLPVSAASLPLPAGASTSANQTTGNASLSSIDGKLPVLSGGSVPITGALTDTQLRASAVPVTLASTTITGTVAVASVGGSVEVTNDAGNPIPVSGTVAATQSGTWNVGTLTTLGTITNVVHVDDNGGSVTVDAPVGTPVFVRLSDGTAPLTILPVSLASLPALAAGTNIIGKVTIKDISDGDYETVAASQTDQALGATGASGDYLSGVLIIPATTSPGAVSIKDGSGSAITVFTGGTGSVSNLVPFFVPLGVISGGGAWKVTTGANVSAVGVGNFT